MTRRDPSVTMLVPVRNEAGYIDVCVRALMEQTDLPADYEILVVDGMSDDGTRERLQDLAREDPRIQILDNPKRVR